MKFANPMPQAFRPTIVGGARRMRRANVVQCLDVRRLAGFLR
jgi:hypothetical protein